MVRLLSGASSPRLICRTAPPTLTGREALNSGTPWAKGMGANPSPTCGYTYQEQSDYTVTATALSAGGDPVQGLSLIHI